MGDVGSKREEPCMTLSLGQNPTRQKGLRSHAPIFPLLPKVSFIPACLATKAQQQE